MSILVANTWSGLSRARMSNIKRAVLAGLALMAVLAVSAAPPPQKPWWHRLLPTVSGDIAMTKENAIRGNTQSQLTLADTLAANAYSAQAVTWYRKAADQGNVEAMFHLGE